MFRSYSDAAQQLRHEKTIGNLKTQITPYNGHNRSTLSPLNSNSNIFLQPPWGKSPCKALLRESAANRPSFQPIDANNLKR